MDLAEAQDASWRVNRVLNPLHSMIYFAQEGEERYPAVGLRPGRMGYFASRSAPFGPVGAGVVAATFYNFNPVTVAKYVPRAWTLATPQQVLAARFDVADAALRRLLGDEAIASADLAEAADLAREASAGCRPDGRPLYAAHAEVEWPTEPHLVLWHAASLLREHRGDGHIAALVTHDLDGLEALITHTATGTGFTEPMAKLSRGWSDEEWAACAKALAAKGILDETQALTEQGTELRKQVEDLTNHVDAPVWQRFGATKSQRLHDLARVLARQAVAAGAFPTEGVFKSRR